MIIYNRNEYSELKPHQYKKEKHRLQIELLKLQEWVVDTDQRIAIVFEGRDAAGKGSTIKRFIENLMPKAAKIIELGVPSKKQVIASCYGPLIWKLSLNESRKLEFSVKENNSVFPA